MKLKAIQCPSCGAHIKIDVNSNSNICSFCGSQVIQDKKGFEISFKSKNETKIRKADIYKELELERMRIKEKEKKSSMTALIGIFVGCIVICLIMTVIENKDKNAALKNGGIEIPQSSKDYKNHDYKVIKSEFEALGFTNIKEEPIDDLITGIITKDGSIERISINGNSEFQSGDVFPSDSSVIIAYHTFPEKEEKDNVDKSNTKEALTDSQDKSHSDSATLNPSDTNSTETTLEKTSTESKKTLKKYDGCSDIQSLFITLSSEEASEYRALALCEQAGYEYENLYKDESDEYLVTSSNERLLMSYFNYYSDEISIKYIYYDDDAGIAIKRDYENKTYVFKICDSKKLYQKDDTLFETAYDAIVYFNENYKAEVN